MQYYDLVLASIDSFMKGKTPSETASLKEGGLRYTPEYFDKLEEDMGDLPDVEETESESEDDA
jgi:hypothetical protein